MSTGGESEESEVDISSSYSSEGEIQLDTISDYSSTFISDPSKIKPTRVTCSDSGESESDFNTSSSYSTDGEITCSSREVREKMYQGGHVECGLTEINFHYWFLQTVTWCDKKKMEEISVNGTEGVSVIYPPCQYFLPPVIQDKLCLLTQQKGTVVYVKSPIMTLEILQGELSAPDTVICDLFIFPPSHPVKILTFCTKSTSYTRHYNSILAQWLTDIVRENVTPDFHIEHGVIQEEDLKSEWRRVKGARHVVTEKEERVWEVESRKDGMNKQLMEIKKVAEDTAITGSLEMTDTKQATVFHAFLHKMTAIQKMSELFEDMVTSQFVETATYQAARKLLQQENVLILTGGAGEGKTAITHRLCYDYHQQGYNTVYYSREQDINWDALSVTTSTLVICDNVTDGRKLIYNVPFHTAHGIDLIKVVVVTRRQMRGDVGFPTIDITEVHKQNTEASKQEYLQMIQKQNPMVSDMLCKVFPFVGFPRAVKWYRKYKHCVDPVTYFTHPVQYFVEEMETMAMESDMSELVLLLLNGGECIVRAEMFDDLDESLKLMNQLFMTSTSVVRRLCLCKHSYVDAVSRNDSRHLYFSHPAIYDACLFVMDRKFPGFLWKHCKVEFEQNKGQFYIRLSKLTVFISRQNTDMFLTQMAEDLSQGKFKHSLSHPVLRKQGNIDRLFTQLGDRMKNIVEAEEDSRSFLCWVVQSENQSLLKTVLQKSGIIQSSINRAFADLVNLSQNTQFLVLRKMLKEEVQNLHYEVNCTDSDMSSLLINAAKLNNVQLVKMMLEDGANLTIKNVQGNTFLHVACQQGYTDLVKCALNIIPDSTGLIVANKGGNTPLHIVCQIGQTEVVEWVLNKMEDTSPLLVKNNAGNTALHTACEMRQKEVVMWLLNKMEDSSLLEMKNNDGNTPLHITCHMKQTEVVEWLLNKMEDSSPLVMKNNDGNTPLHIACQMRQTEVVMWLLNKMEDSSPLVMKNNDGNTPLHITCHMKQTEVVEWLLNKMEDSSPLVMKNNDGNTPLHIACEIRDTYIAKRLLNCMPDTSDLMVVNNNGNTPVHISSQKGQSEIVKCCLDTMKDSSSLQLKNREGNTALHILCLYGNMNMVKRLLQEIRDYKDLPGNDLQTPVMMAALKAHYQLYEYLADVEKCQLTGLDDNGDTILHLACVGGNLDIVKHLVESGIDKNQRGQYGKTPVMIAAYWKHRELFEWLLEQKCHISSDDFIVTELVLNGYINNSTDVLSFIKSREHGERDYYVKPFKHQISLRKHLESKGSNMLFDDESGMSLLHTAANTGHLELADFLLSVGYVDINIRDSSRRTPVMLSIARGHTQMFDFLLDRGCDVKVKDDYDKTLLSYAVEAGDKLVFNSLSDRGIDISVIDTFRNSLLHLACKGGNSAIVEHLLSLGLFDINALNMEHRSPLLVAAHGGHTAVCIDLIDMGADLYVQDRDGKDVLLVAADEGNTQLTKYILMREKGVIIKKDVYGRTAQMVAAQKAHQDVFHMMIAYGNFDLSEKDCNGRNTLHYSCSGGSVYIVGYILSQSKIDINSRDRYKRAPVMYAAEKGHKDVFELLFRKGCDLSVVDSDNGNILHYACSGGSVNIVQFIVSQSVVDKNSRDSLGKTPMMYSAEKGHGDVFELLVREACDLTVVDINHSNILHYACSGGSVDIVQFIVSQNVVDINSRDRLNRTPVLKALEKGYIEVFELLVRAGCDLTVVDKDGGNVLHYACTGGSMDMVQTILSQNIVKKAYTDWWGKTPLMYAAEKRQKHVFELLVTEGCDLSEVDSDDGNILHYACLGGSVEIVQFIVSQNVVDINSTDWWGKTPVMYAAEKGHWDVFVKLVREGCDLTVVDIDGDNVLHYACTGGNVDIVQNILAQHIVDRTKRNWFGKTPLMKAKLHRHSAVVDLISYSEALG